jgi:hypothetical protein
MQLNEIIEENTLPAISRKTRLSIENLEKLFENNFSGFRKVQALGFISILEREYRADLSDLREACETFFSENNVLETPKRSTEAHLNPPHKKSTVVDINMSRRGPSFIKPLVVSVVAVGLLYAAWQTYSTQMESTDTNISRQGEDIGFFATIINQTKKWMGGESPQGLTGEETTDTDETAWGEDDNTTDNTFVIAETSQNSSVPDKEVATESTDQEESDIIQKVKEEQAKKIEAQRKASTDAEMQNLDDAIASAVEDNTTSDEPLATEVPSIANDTQQLDEEQNIVKEATLAEIKAAAEAKALEEKKAARKKAEETAARQKAAKEKIAREKKAREKAAQEKAAKSRKIILKPRSKVWLGIVDLRTMKRSTATSKARVVFDKPDGRWIVATGHGRFDFKIGSKQMKVNDGKQHFLLIEKGTVKEIPHATFQTLNKSKVW